MKNGVFPVQRGIDLLPVGEIVTLVGMQVDALEDERRKTFERQKWEWRVDYTEWQCWRNVTVDG